jgi:hypothetical protein
MFHALKLNEAGECMIDSLAAREYFVGIMRSSGSSSTVCWAKTLDLKAGDNVELPLGEMTGAITLNSRTTPLTDVSSRLIKDDQLGHCWSPMA